MKTLRTPRKLLVAAFLSIFMLQFVLSMKNSSAYIGIDESFSTYTPTTQIKNINGWNNWVSTGGILDAETFTEGSTIRATTYWNAWTTQTSCSFTADTETGSRRGHLIDASNSRRINPVCTFGSSSGATPGTFWVSFDVKAVSGGNEEFRLGDSADSARVRIVFHTNNSIGYYGSGTIHPTGTAISTTGYTTIYIHTVTASTFYLKVNGTKYPASGVYTTASTFTGAISEFNLYTGVVANSQCNVYFDNVRTSWYTLLSNSETKYVFTAQTRKSTTQGYFSRINPGDPSSFPVYTFTSAQTINTGSVNVTVDLPAAPTAGDIFIRFKNGATDITRFKFQNASAGQNIQVYNNNAWSTLAGYTTGTRYVIKTNYLTSTTFDIVINATSYTNGGLHYTKSAATTSLVDSLSLEQNSGALGSIYIDDIDASWLGIAPDAAFSANATLILQGSTVAFTHSGTNGDQTPCTYQWSFGDSTSNSTSENATHQYTIAGNYTVILTVTNTNGDKAKETKTSYIDVIAYTTLDSTFIANATSIVVGGWVLFSHTGGEGVQPTTYTWSFGDSTTNGTLHEQPHQYIIAGTYTVILVTRDSASQASKTTRTNYITVSTDTLPDAAFTVNETRPADFADVLFTHTGSNGNLPVTYQWDMGDGSANQTTENVTYEYLTDGFFTVTLTIVDLNGDMSVVQKVDYIEMGCTVDPNATFSANATLIIAGQYVNFTHTGTNGNDLPNTYLWSFGDGTYSMFENRTHQYLAPGNYTVNLTITDAHGCVESVEIVSYIDVVVDLTPETNFTSNATTCIEGQSIAFTRTGLHGNNPATYAWDFGDLTANSTDHDPVHVYAAAGTYTVSLMVTDADGDVSLTTRVDYITVEADIVPDATFTANDTLIIAGESVAFTHDASSGNEPAIYAWDFGNGFPNATTENATHVYTTSGNFTVTLTITDANGDWDVYAYPVTIDVVESSTPEATFTANTTSIVAGQSVQFTHTGSEGNILATHQWDFGDGTANATSENPSHQYTVAGTYTVTMTIVDADSDMDVYILPTQITVDADLVPTATFTANATTLILGQNVTFTHTGDMGNTPTTHQWDFGDDTFGDTVQMTISHRYQDPGIYNVSLAITDTDGDTTYYSMLITVLVDLIPSSLFYANVTSINETQWVFFSHNGSAGNTPSTYSWDFGDGSTSTDENVTHQYTEIGKYTVILTVTDTDGDIVSRERVNYIYVYWNHTSPVEICLCTDFQFYAESGDGSAGDPWIIENFNVSSGIITSVNITDTRDYLIIQDGIMNGTIALSITNATTVTVTNCTFASDVQVDNDSLTITFSENAYHDYFTVSGSGNRGWDDMEIMDDPYSITNILDASPVYSNYLFGVSSLPLVTVTFYRLNASGDTISLSYISFSVNGTMKSSRYLLLGDGFNTFIINDNFGNTMHSWTYIVNHTDGSIDIVLTMYVFTFVNTRSTHIDVQIISNHISETLSIGAGESDGFLLYTGSINYDVASSTGATLKQDTILLVSDDSITIYESTGGGGNGGGGDDDEGGEGSTILDDKMIYFWIIIGISAAFVPIMFYATIHDGKARYKKSRKRKKSKPRRSRMRR